MGFPGASRKDLVAATSAAIWSISDAATISGLAKGAQRIYDSLIGSVERLPLVAGDPGGLIVESSGQDVVIVPPRDAPKPSIRTVASFSESSVVKTLPGRASKYMYDTVYIENIYPGYELSLIHI